MTRPRVLGSRFGTLLALSVLGGALVAIGCSSSGNSGGSSTPAPLAISSLSSSTGAVGAALTIAGSGFGSTQGSSVVEFNGAAAGGASAWSGTSITITVPASATTGNVTVLVGNSTSNGEPFEVLFSCATLPALGDESLLSGHFVDYFDGFADSAGSPAGTAPFQFTGAFSANGSGIISGGELDAGSVYDASGTTLLTISSGCYDLGSNLQGLMIWNFVGGGSHVFAFSMVSTGVSAHFILFDDFNSGTTPGFRGSGGFGKESSSTFSASQLSGNYAFRLAGSNNDSTGVANYQRRGMVGVLTFGGSALTVSSTVDAAQVASGAQQNVDALPVVAASSGFTAPDSLGRGVLTLTFDSTAVCGSGNGGVCSYSLSYYLVGNGDVFLQGLGASTPLFNGEAVAQSGTFNSAIMSGDGILTITGEDLTNHSYTVEAAGQVSSNGSGSASAYLDKESDGTILDTGTTQITGGAFSVNANGLATLTIGSGSSALYFDLAMVTQNTGFVLEGTQANPGTNVMIGMIVPQTVTSTLSSAHMFSFGPVFPATTDVNVVSGAASFASGAFDGSEDVSSGLACSAGCLDANQVFDGTYSIDGNGRITVTPEAGGTALIGWVFDVTEFAGFTPSSNAAMTFFTQ